MNEEEKKWDPDAWKITCPHCGYEHYDWHEYIETSDMDGEFEMECIDCGEEFKVKFRTLIDFQSEIPNTEE